MYIKTYQISTKTVDTVLKRIINGSLIDERGESGAQKNKTLSEEIINKVISHIAKFPTYVLHYSRKETELAVNLTLNKMYHLYVESNPKVSFATYKKNFYKNFNQL